MKSPIMHLKRKYNLFQHICNYSYNLWIYEPLYSIGWRKTFKNEIELSMIIVVPQKICEIPLIYSIITNTVAIPPIIGCQPRLTNWIFMDIEPGGFVLNFVFCVLCTVIYILQKWMFNYLWDWNKQKKGMQIIFFNI